MTRGSGSFTKLFIDMGLLIARTHPPHRQRAPELGPCRTGFEPSVTGLGNCGILAWHRGHSSTVAAHTT